jgi:hypothetical protein
LLSFVELRASNSVSSHLLERLVLPMLKQTDGVADALAGINNHVDQFADAQRSLGGVGELGNHTHSVFRTLYGLFDFRNPADDL